MDLVELQQRTSWREWQSRQIRHAMLVKKTEGSRGLTSLTVVFHKGRGNTVVGKWNRDDAFRYYYDVTNKSGSEGVLLVEGTWYDVQSAKVERTSYGPWHRTWYLEPHGGFAASDLDWWLR